MAEIELVRGADKDLVLLLKDSVGDPIDISGRTLLIFDVSRALLGKVSGAITDGPAGELSIHVEGTTPIPLGLHSFRVQLTAGTASIAIKPIQLRVV